MFTWIRTLASRTWTLLSSRQVDRDFERELETHLDLLTEENVRRGMTPKEARRVARIRLGGNTQLRDINRELRGLPFIETVLQDVRFAFRTLRKNPGFTAVAVLTLALGIGANTAIFSVVYAVLLKPLPYAQPDQLFNVFQAQPQEGIPIDGWSYPNFKELREQNHVFTELAGNQHHQLALTGHGEPTVVNTSVVTPELFSVFGEKPLAGRVFYSDDGKPGAAPVVILSENLWRGVLGADPNIIGSNIDLDKRSFTVVGIMPAAFRFPLLTETEQLWIPLVQDPLFGSWMPRRGGHWLTVTGRLKPGVSRKQAQTELDAISARLAKEFPRGKQWVGDPHEPAPAGYRRRCEVPSACVAGCRGPCAADRLRQYRQLTSYARDFSSARDCHSGDARRRASADCSPVIERVRSARSSWRGGRHCSRLLGCSRAELSAAAKFAPNECHSRGRFCLGVCASAFRDSKLRLWFGPGAFCGQCQLAIESSRRRRPFRRKPSIAAARAASWRQEKLRSRWCCW